MVTSVLLLSLCGVGMHAAMADWPHWRGPSRNGLVEEPSGWDGSEWSLEPAWTVNVGEGSASPLIVGNRVYAMGSRNNEEHLICLDLEQGTEVWRRWYSAPRYGRRSNGDKGLYGGISSTPEYDPATGLLYTLGIDGDLRCWNALNDGAPVWDFNLYERYDVGQRPDVGGLRGGASLRDYGYTTSPLVWEHMLIVEAGDTRTGSVKGYHKLTGEELWTSELREEAGHTGGLAPIDVEGIPCVAVLTMRSLSVIRLDGHQAGQTLGRVEWTTDFANNIPTPAVHGNLIVVTSAYNQYAMGCFEATSEGLRERWRNEHPSGVCSPVIHEGHIYWSWQEVHCVRLNDGQHLWQGGGTGYPGSCLVTQDGRLIVWSDQGELILVETAARAPAAYRELARLGSQFRTDAWPHLALASGRLLVKDREGHLRCLQVGN